MSEAGDITLDELRVRLRELTALAGSAEKPKPTHRLPPGHSMGEGVEWIIDFRSHDLFDQTRKWQVLVRDADDVADCVYIHTPDSMPGDYVSSPTIVARNFAMAVLAACDISEQNAAGVIRLSDRKSET